MVRTVLLALALCPVAAGRDDKSPPDNVSPPPGFVSLFNGKDFTNWRQVDGGGLSPKSSTKFRDTVTRWRVADGAIEYDPDPKAAGGHLFTDKEYKNWELRCDWKLTKGIAGLVTSPALIKIWDGTGEESKPWRLTGSGSLGFGGGYGKPLKKADNPLGEWNTFRVLVENAPDPKDAARGKCAVSIWLNGELVIDRQPRTNARSRFGFQDHGGRIAYKNVYLKELPD